MSKTITVALEVVVDDAADPHTVADELFDLAHAALNLFEIDGLESIDGVEVTEAAP